MTNPTIAKALEALTEQLMAASEVEDWVLFDQLYADLKAICQDNEQTADNHPEQWETLGDFTEDLVEALPVYEQALLLAENIESDRHIASICFSIASVKYELEQPSDCPALLERAKEHAAKYDDVELIEEIDELANSL